MKKIILATALFGILSARAITPGEWNSDFTSSWAYAEKSATPIVVVWGNTSCGYCTKLHDVLESETVMEWVQEHPVILVSKYEEYVKEQYWNEDYAAAEEWIRSRETDNLSGYPHVGVYWKKADGTVVASSAFTGRVGKMPVKTPKNNLAAQFVANLDALIGDYGGAGGISFVTADTEEDRLEADSTTPYVYVPLTRASSAKVSSCVLVATFPGGDSVRYSVTWAVGEASKYVKVSLPLVRPIGKMVTLSLLNSAEETVATSSITFVADVENAPKNPHWVGEYTAATLPYGEWTMDFTTAKEKIQRFGGKMLAMFGGPLWCPNCVAIEDDIFSTATFRNWAKEQKLVLVHFDQGRASSPATAEGTMQARLLTCTPSQTTGASGASYLSRHGIDPSSAVVQEVIDRVTELTAAWLPPESTATRLGNPTVLLLNDAGTDVDGRFVRQKDGYSMDLDENMCRFEALLKLVGANEDEGYRSVTPLTILTNEAMACTLQVNAATKYYRVMGLKAGYGLEVSAGEEAGVTISVLTDDGEQLVTGTGKVSIAEPLSEEQASALYLKVAAFENSASTFYGADNIISFALTAKAVEATEAAFSDYSKKQIKAMNPLLGTRLNSTIPLFSMDDEGVSHLAGTVVLSLTTANKISAKVTIGSQATAFSGTWQKISPSTGLVSTELDKKGAILALTFDKQGAFTAEYRATAEATSLQGQSMAGDFTSFVGRYTVTLVSSESNCGTGVLTINIAKSGKATVGGTMPDGTAISVSSVLCLNADSTAMLPILKTSSKGALSLALTINPNAAETWGDEGNMDTVLALHGCSQTWTSSSLGEMAFAVYGGYWKSGTSPLAVCAMFELSKTLSVVIGSATNDSVTATKSGFTLNSKNVLTSLSFTKTSGAFSGKAKVKNSSGKSVSAVIKGVLLPGWIDCGCTGEVIVERPFGSGTLYYKDGGALVSLPIDLIAQGLAE